MKPSEICLRSFSFCHLCVYGDDPNLHTSTRHNSFLFVFPRTTKVPNYHPLEQLVLEQEIVSTSSKSRH